MAEQIKFGDKLFLKGEKLILDNGASDAIIKSGNGTLKIDGNLTVSGTTTTVESETVTIADNILLINSNATGTPSENGGFEIERGISDNASILWNETSDKFELKVGSVSADLVANIVTATSVIGAFSGDLSGDVTSTGLSTFSSIDINGGNIDGTVIGATNPQVGTFTTLTGTLDYSNLINVPANFTELVEDTTPQLGGNLDLNTFDLTTTDNFATLTTSKSSGNTATVAATTETNLSNLTISFADETGNVSTSTNAYTTLTGTEIINLGFKGEVSLSYFGAAAPTSNFVFRDVSDNAEQNDMVVVYSSSLDEYTFTLDHEILWQIDSTDTDVFFKQYAYGEMAVTSATALTTSNTQFRDSNGFDIDVDHVTITNTSGTNYKIVFWTHDVSVGDVITYIHPSEENTIFGWGGITTTDGRLTLLDSSGDLIYKLPATDGTANQVLKTDGSGDLSWTTVSGGGSSYGDSDVATYLNGNLDTHILPDTNDTYDIGSASFKIRDLYLGDNSLHIGDNTIRTSGSNLLLNGEDIMDYSNVKNKPTTLAGYGITDGGADATYKIEAGNNRVEVYDTSPDNEIHFIINNVARWQLGGVDFYPQSNNLFNLGRSDKKIKKIYLSNEVASNGLYFGTDTLRTDSSNLLFNNNDVQDFTNIKNTPTTLAGYGITDGGGYTAGENITIDGSNVISATQPTYNITDDDTLFNVGLGDETFSPWNTTTTGNYNVAVGWQAMKDATSARNNSAFGTGALRETETGQSNTAVGYATMLQNKTGDMNTAVGRDALGNYDDGDFNVAIGYSAGLGQGVVGGFDGGHRNVFIGAWAGFHVNGSNNVIIGNRANMAFGTGTGDANINNKLIIASNTDSLTGGQPSTNTADVLISGDFSTGNVTFNDTYTFPSTDGTANQVLTTDGAGNLSWTTVGAGLSNLVEDTTPQLGGNLDLQTYNFTTSDTLFKKTIGNTNFEYGSITASGVTATGFDMLTNSNDYTGIGVINWASGGLITGEIIGSWYMDGTTGKSVISGLSTATVDSTTYAATRHVTDVPLVLESNVGTSNARTLAIGPNGTDRLSWLDASYNTIFKFPAADGTASQVLTTDGSGDLSWSTPTITLSTLKSVVAASTDFADFQSRIAAL